MLEVGVGDAKGRASRRTHLGGEEISLHSQIETALRFIHRVAEIGERGGIAVGALEGWGTEWGERFGRDDPGGDRRRKAFAEERAQRLALPALDVARRPIIEQAESEEMIGRARQRHRRAEAIAEGNKRAELELEIEPTRRAELHLAARKPVLAVGTRDRLAAEPYR